LEPRGVSLFVRPLITSLLVLLKSTPFVSLSK
jgi:hypothetical protein